MQCQQLLIWGQCCPKTRSNQEEKIKIKKKTFNLQTIVYRRAYLLPHYIAVTVKMFYNFSVNIKKIVYLYKYN